MQAATHWIPDGWVIMKPEERSAAKAVVVFPMSSTPLPKHHHRVYSADGKVNCSCLQRRAHKAHAKRGFCSALGTTRVTQLKPQRCSLTAVWDASAKSKPPLTRGCEQITVIPQPPSMEINIKEEIHKKTNQQFLYILKRYIQMERKFMDLLSAVYAFHCLYTVIFLSGIEWKVKSS